jgi:hypothetical protein
MAAMLRALAVFSSLALAQNAAEPELVRAAKSPYDFSRYVDTHPKIDWNAMWHALGVQDTKLLGCGSLISRDDPCSTETVTINNPDQVIVILQPEGGGDLYARFQKDPNGDWRLTGRFEAYVKNHRDRHEIFRFGNKPFLKISHQGISGSGADSEVESWFDLTLPSFDPIFGITLEGHLQRYGIGPSSSLSTLVSTDIVEGKEEIQVVALVRYSVMEEQDLGFATYTGVYERAPGQREFSFKSGKGQGAAMSQTDFDQVANITDDGPSPEKLLVYALDGLKKVASGKDADAKDWLQYVLSRCKDTQEKRTLLDLLAKP